MTNDDHDGGTTADAPDEAAGPLAGARSLRRGTLDGATLPALVKDLLTAAGRDEDVEALVDDVDTIVDDISDFAGDVFLYEGDLHVTGDFDTMDLGVLVLVVTGDLIVSGCYGDYDDPQSHVIVKGSLHARDVWTSGFLTVLKDLDVANAVVGDYNDCDTVVGGDVRCRFFFPEEHYFTVGGALRAAHFAGNTEYRVISSEKYIGMTCSEFTSLYGTDLVAEDSDPSSTYFIDFDKLRKGVHEGRLVF